MLAIAGPVIRRQRARAVQGTRGQTNTKAAKRCKGRHAAHYRSRVRVVASWKPAMPTTLGPLVSTIIPTYNRADKIGAAVQSALEQTWPHQETIVVDDGSTDDTSAVLARLRAPGVRVLRKANGGVSSARNFGVAHARGDLIAFLDSDDVWRPDKLAKQVGFFAAHPGFALVLTDVEKVDEQGRPLGIFKRRDVIPHDGDVLPFVLRDPRLVPPSIMITRAAWDDVGGFDTGLATGEDLDFHLRVALRHRIGVVEEPLVRCARGHDGLSTMGGSHRAYVRVMERFLREAGEAVDAPMRREVLLNTYLRNLPGLAVQGDYVQAAHCLGHGVSMARSPGEALALGQAVAQALRGLTARVLRAVAGR